jgi:short-subunit dehydrogenase
MHAWNGLIHTVVHQRNMRMHVIAGLLVGLVGGGIPLGLAEKVTLIFCVLLVLFAEMLNSAMEQLVDLAVQQFDEKAKLTKDIAAAGVLVLAIGTVVIFAAVVVHNAGVPSFGRLESLVTADIQRVLHTNLLAPMLLTQAMLPHLRRLSQAQVICVGSALGRIGLPGFSVYSASKFGLRGFAEALRRELGDSTVRIQYLGPRSTRTGFNSAEVETYNRATGAATDTPQQVALALLELLESEAAERYLGFPEKLAVRLNGLAPSLLDSAFDRHRNSLPTASLHSASPVQSNPPRTLTPSSRTEP